MPVGCGTNHLPSAWHRYRALDHFAGGKALAYDQTPSLSTRVSEVVHCVRGDPEQG